MPDSYNHNELVLVVEDDPINLKFVQKILDDAGYRLRSAADGQQCLDSVVQVLPQLILMDINMPSIDGLETCRRLKCSSVTRDIPVIFVTGNTGDEVLEMAFAVGGCDYVVKPINRIELLARVRSALDQRQAAFKLAEEEKLKAVLETAGGICHELNQPLQYVLGAIQLLMLDMPSEAPIHKTLDDMRIRVEQMGDITRKLSEITQYHTRDYAGGQQIIDLRRSIKKYRDGL